MGQFATSTFTVMALAAGAPAYAAPGAAGAPATPAEGNDFVLHESGTAKEAHGAKASKIVATKTEAAMKLVVIEKDKGPVKGVVISLAAPDGTKYYTEETDAEGYAEVLVPAGQKYEITYLSLGRKDVAATVSVTNEPKQNVKLTLRFKRLPPPPPLVLSGSTSIPAKRPCAPNRFLGSIWS